MSDPRPIIDEAGYALPASPASYAWRYVTCLGDLDRPACSATIRQHRRPNGLWAPHFCEDCDAACAARRARETEREAA